jgi:hypothetical protein
MLRSRRSPASTGSMGGMPPDVPAEPWVKKDLFFLEDSLRRGMSFAEVAGFLCRTEDEVRAKAKALKYLEHRQRRA